MRYAAPISALALATVALAQDQTIHVGNDGSGNAGLFFSPNSISATQGSVITFVFDTPGSNHTVAQSAFATPCEPLQGGFDSGYTPGPANAGDPASTWNLTITDTSKAIWFYCAQPTKTHCIAGMVGAINAPAAPATNDFDSFMALATGASTIVQPTPALVGSGASASAAPSVFVTSDSAATTTGAATDSNANSTPASSTGGAATNTGASAAATNTVTSTGSSTSTSTSAAAGQTSNAAVAGVGAVTGTNGLVWAVAAVFGVALL